MKLLEYLMSEFQYGSTTKARKLLKAGHVRVNDEVVVRADHEVMASDGVKVAGRGERKQARAPFTILYEDDAIVIAVKPAGMLSVDRENEHTKSFFKMVRAWTHVYLTHRLDRDVSGAMIFAKSIEIEKRLEEGWSENDKIYWAIVEGQPPEREGLIENWLAESRELKVYATQEGPDSRRAVTRYRVIESWGDRSLVEVKLETGRKHQIRVHLSDIGCPIIGDKKYGSKIEMKGRIALHAFRLSLNHPVSGERISVVAPLPKEMDEILGRFTVDKRMR